MNLHSMSTTMIGRHCVSSTLSGEAESKPKKSCKLPKTLRISLGGVVIFLEVDHDLSTTPAKEQQPRHSVSPKSVGPPTRLFP